MKSDTGALLTKIAAIVDFVLAGFVFLAGIVIGLGFSFYSEEMGISPIIVLVIIILISVLVFVMGTLFMSASRKMKDPRTVRNGAIWAIVLGVINIGNISGILSLIGGIIALSDSDKKG